VRSGALQGARFALRRFGRCEACEAWVLEAHGSVGAGLVGTWFSRLELCRCEVGGGW
jgi:hypothetical protein